MSLQNDRADAVAIIGDRITAVGRDSEILALAGPETELIDVRGAAVMPGFIEGHGHLVRLGESLVKPDLAGATSWPEVVDIVRATATAVAPGTWIEGMGWHQDKWVTRPADAVEGFPTHRRLSELIPAHPVVLRHASGHAILANRRAMDEAGVDKETPNPEGGHILRGASGELTGLFREDSAMELIYVARDSSLSSERKLMAMREAIGRAAHESLRHGVTTFHDADASFERVDVYRAMIDDGELPIRVYALIEEDYDALVQKLPSYRTVAYGDDRLTVRAIKVSIDGALGSRSAWLLDPYEDEPTQAGINQVPIPLVERTAALALEHGFQMCVHAIGDRANREVLDLYARVAGDRIHDVRWRIEHAQHLDPRDIPRFGKMGVIAAMQGVHCTSDAGWVPDRIGNRRAEEGAYVWRKLLDSGAIISNGTDVPVEPIDPIANFYSSITRSAAEGPFYPDQSMSRVEALRSYTISNAYAAFEEELKGTLEPGKLADVVVVSQDILAVDIAAITKSRVLLTMVGGEVVYRADSF